MKKLVILCFLLSLNVLAQPVDRIQHGGKTYITHTENFDLDCRTEGPLSRVLPAIFIANQDERVAFIMSPENQRIDSRRVGQRIVGEEFMVARVTRARCGTCHMEINLQGGSTITIKNERMTLEEGGEVVITGQCKANEPY